MSGIVAMTLNKPTLVSSTFANFTANITSNGGSSVTSRGFCWNTATSPTIDDFKLTSGYGNGTLTGTLSSLLPNTTYFVRAFAVNEAGISYSSEQIFTTTSTVTDADGNVYNSITIGNQTWLVENLKTTKYNDGTAIPLITANATWVSTTSGAYCWYNNSVEYKTKYGALYNGYAVRTGKLAPVGWRVATYDDWKTLETYVSVNSGVSVTVGKALSYNLDWNTSTAVGAIGNNLSLNNSTGFSALPGGYRDSYGVCDYLGYQGCWWTSTDSNSTASSVFYLNYDKYTLGFNNYARNLGYSVRCVKK